MTNGKPRTAREQQPRKQPRRDLLKQGQGTGNGWAGTLVGSRAHWRGQPHSAVPLEEALSLAVWAWLCRCRCPKTGQTQWGACGAAQRLLPKLASVLGPAGSVLTILEWSWSGSEAENTPRKYTRVGQPPSCCFSCSILNPWQCFSCCLHMESTWRTSGLIVLGWDLGADLF